MKERARIDNKRKAIILFLVLTVAAQIFFIGMIAEKTFMVRDMGSGIETNLEEVRKDMFEASLKNQSSKIETVRETWRSMYGMVGEIGDEEMFQFLFNVVSIVEGVDEKEEILVVERETGLIVFPFEREGENLRENIVDERMVSSVLSSRDITYPNYFVGCGDGTKGIPGELLLKESKRFGERTRIFYSKVTIPRPRTGEKEFIILAGFKEDRVVESYRGYSESLESQVNSIRDASQTSLNLVIASMITVILLGIIIAYSLRFIMWDIYRWEKRKDKYEECEKKIKDME